LSADRAAQEEFGGYDDRKVEGQGSDADGGAGMLPDLRAEDIDDDLRETIDDVRGLGVSRLSLYEAVDRGPGTACAVPEPARGPDLVL
jgi:hypothetical protein